MDIEKINKYFNTNVPEERFREVFDEFPSKEQFEYNTEEKFEEMEKKGFAAVIDGKYVFLLDTNLKDSEKDASENGTAKVEVKYILFCEASESFNVTPQELELLKKGELPDWIDSEMNHSVICGGYNTDWCAKDENTEKVISGWSNIWKDFELV